ncbi:hypothetical protein PM082_004835 [Marasmius tenuissimus]|nr:hypothetical protein PM082_004835 [Marasmius tenuissimus]
MSAILANAHNTTIGNNANFQTTARDVITHHYHGSESGDLLTMNGRTVRRVIDGDIIYQRLLSSKVLSIDIKPEGASTSTVSQVFRVKKMVQTARLYGHQGRFTATTFEPVDEKDRDNFVKLVKKVLEAAMCRRSALLTQLFAVAESDALTMIAHDELANGEEFAGRYWGKDWIVLYYLSYTRGIAIETLRDDETVIFPVANRLEGWSYSPGVKARFSRSVPWRVDLAFRKTGDVFQVTLELGLRIPENDRNRLRRAYLCQSLDFSDNSDNVGYVTYVDEIGFYLKGTFLNDPTSLPIPTYLFFLPLPTEYINITHCVCYPFPQKLFYWSHDPQGRTAIDKEDWEKFGIPELSVQEWIGTGWRGHCYAFVRDHLCSRGYELDGKQYARDHAYPELIHADPHNTVGLEKPKIASSQLVIPLASSSLDFLCLIASSGGRFWGSLSEFALHGTLTFGTVIDYHNHKILAYLPSSPRPEWFYKSINPDVKADCSVSVPWRVDLLHHKAGNARVALEFGLCISEEVRNRLGAAYLCQSLPFCDVSNDPSHVVYIDQVGFRLIGTFLEEPAACSPPAYLFVPPLQTELIDDMHCIQLPQRVFYWSHDPQGRDAIPKEDWRKFGIPELTVEEWIGSNWEWKDYTTVWGHLSSRKYNPKGRRYASMHRYPKLVAGDPHDIARTRNKVLRHPDSGRETVFSPSQLAFPLSSPPVKVSAELHRDPNHEDTPTSPKEGTATHWAKRGFLKKLYHSVLETVTQADDLEYSVVAC